MKILLVSFLFPPYNAIGAVRVGKLAKFLTAAGDDVRVLAAHRANLPEQLPVEISAEHIVATPWLNINRVPLALIGGLEEPVRRGEARRGRAVEALGKVFRSVFNMPDGQIGWLPYAVRAGLRLIREWQPDLIYASGMPFTSFLVASHLSRRTGIPWIAEYRDLWTDSHYYDQPRWRHGLEARLENATVRSAAGLVTVSGPLADTLSARFLKPTQVTLNGYDTDDIPAEGEVPAESKNLLRVVYTGLIYQGQRDPSPLFAAMQMLPDAYRERVRVEFYGRMLPEIMLLARRYGVEMMVRCMEPVSYSRSLKLQRGADALLLLLWNDPRERGVFTGKLFEYMGAQRRILATGLETGVAADLIREREAGFVSNDPAQIADALVQWCDEKAARGRALDLPLASRAGLSRAEQFSSLRLYLGEILAARQKAAAPVPILVVIPKLDVGGTEQHLLSVLPRLDPNSYRVEMFALAGGGALEEPMRASGIPVHSPPGWARGWGRRVYAAAQLIWHVWRNRKGIIHLFLPEAYIIGGLIGVGLRCRSMVMSRRSLNVYQRKYPVLSRLEHWLHRRMTVVLGNSEAVLGELQLEGVPSARMRLVRNAVDIARFGNIPSQEEARRQLDIAERSLVIAIVANLLPYKGHGDLLRALAAAGQRLPSNWTLLCAGRDSGMGAELQRLAADLGIAQHVRWLGEQRNIARVFRAADIGILCSHEEGSPNSVIEGMALGLPMVVTDVGGARELCRQGENAIVVPSHAPQALADAIVMLSQSPDRRRGIGKIAADYVRGELSLARCIDGYSAVYSELAERLAPQPGGAHPARYS